MVGFRTPAGIVTTTQSFKTIEIPRLVRGKPGAWDPLVCLDWGHTFISFLKEKILKEASHLDKPASVWRVKFTPRVGISVGILDPPGVENVAGGEDRVGFLPTWYWKELSDAHMDPLIREPEAKGASETPIANVGWQI